MAGDGPNIENDKDSKYPEFHFYLPEEMKGRSKWYYIYDPQRKAILGRTGKRWGICFLFYLVFYSMLALLWISMFYISMNIYWNREGPYLTLEDSRIGKNPSLVQYPSTKTITIKSNVTEHKNTLMELLSRYQRLNPDDYTDCQKSPSNPEDCYFDIDELGNCTSGSSFGYAKNEPCIFLRLNKVYSWTPNVYSKSNELPDDMPSSLKDYIKKQESDKRNMIWVSCYEKVKKESYLKDLYYWPGQGFPAYFYPFKGKKKHLNPIIAVQFFGKKAGVPLRIECKAWAKDLTSTTTFTIYLRK